jgi:hypothetical protein
MGLIGPDGGNHNEAAQESFPDDLDQSPEFDPTDPEPIPEDDFDQSGRVEPERRGCRSGQSVSSPFPLGVPQ